MSEPSLQSARLNSIAIVLVGYVGLSFAWQHYERLFVLHEARQAVVKAVAGLPELPASISGLGRIEYLEKQRVSAGFLGLGTTNKYVLVFHRRSGGRWSASALTNAESLAKSFPPQDGLNDLRDIAMQLGIVPASDSSYVNLYQQVENRILGATVNVPGTGMGFSGTLVVWASSIAALGLLIVLRNRVEHVLQDPNLALGQKWLIVDGHRGLELVLARGWLVALALLPFCLVAGLILAISSQLIADGANTGLVQDFGTGAAVLGLLVLNGWMALASVSKILELRRLRLERTRDPAKAVADAEAAPGGTES